MERHSEQGSADETDVRQVCVWGGNHSEKEHKEHRRETEHRNTGEREVESDSKTQEDISSK